MLADLAHDPFFQCGCLGYGLRVMAHWREPHGYFASLEIRDDWRRGGQIIRMEIFDVMFRNADVAMQCALERGLLVANILRTEQLLAEIIDA